jgi:hypothetical protein
LKNANLYTTVCPYKNRKSEGSNTQFQSLIHPKTRRKGKHALAWRPTAGDTTTTTIVGACVPHPGPCDGEKYANTPSLFAAPASSSRPWPGGCHKKCAMQPPRSPDNCCSMVELPELLG